MSRPDQLPNFFLQENATDAIIKHPSQNNNNPNSVQNNSSELNIFKVPMVPPEKYTDEAKSIPMSLKPVEQQTTVSTTLFKKPKVFNELKVFNNLPNVQQPSNATSAAANNFNTTKQSLSSSGLFDDDNMSKVADLPKNSTPIYTDNTSSAYLLAKRNKIFKNAMMDLTITGTGTTTANNPLSNNKPLYQPQIPERVDEEQQHGSSEESNGNNNNNNNNLAMAGRLSSASQGVRAENGAARLSGGNLKPNGRGSAQPVTMPVVNSPLNGHKTAMRGGGNKMSMHDMSLIAAYENAATSTNLVSVAKVQLPKHVKKTIKDEIKKDKSKCVIS
jgi:hypothetical protein